jgi:hypothetical protein
MYEFFFVSRITAHTTTVFVLYMIRRELALFVHLRHQFLLSHSHSKLVQARTVLITNVPDELANEHDIRQFASFVPGGIDKVWIYRDTKNLNDLFDERGDACNQLEAAESKLLHHATNTWRLKTKAHKKTKKAIAKATGHDTEKQDHQVGENGELEMPLASQELLNELVPAAKRPKHRTGLLGLFGPKVDTIDHCKVASLCSVATRSLISLQAEIARLNTEMKEIREHIVKGKFLGSIFIRCNLQMGAHVLAQCVSYHEVRGLLTLLWAPILISSTE